jgi:hypothetical protein
MKKFCSGGVCALLFLGICVGFILIVYLRSEEVAQPDAAPQVLLHQGALRGHRLTTRKGRHVLAFEGIPYAAPPTGDLRFRVCSRILYVTGSSLITFALLCKRLSPCFLQDPPFNSRTVQISISRPGYLSRYGD